MAPKKQNFNPEKDIPDLSGKVILVTGGNAGLGKAAITALAKHKPAHIYMAGRSSTRCQAAILSIQETVPKAPITFLELDLSSLASVQKAAQTFVAASPRLDLLMCNGGIMAVGPGLTVDGYEVQFGTNHLGHALLIKLLLPTLLETTKLPGADVRVISMTSSGHFHTPPGGIVFADLRTTQPSGFKYPSWARYGQSKLANVLYATQLAKHYPSITSVSIHPGIVDTGLLNGVEYDNPLVKVINSVFLWYRKKPIEVGVLNQLWASTAKKSEVKNGEYFEPIGVTGKSKGEAYNEKLGQELWDFTEKALEGYSL